MLLQQLFKGQFLNGRIDQEEFCPGRLFQGDFCTGRKKNQIEQAKALDTSNLPCQVEGTYEESYQTLDVSQLIC